MANNRQSGSAAHIIIVILLVLSIFGAIGWVVWANFLAPSSRTVTPDDVSSVLIEGSIDNRYPSKISWQYPQDWTMTSTWQKNGENGEEVTPATGNSAYQTVTITSPSKKYRVTYGVGTNGQLGGACSATPGTVSSFETKEVLAANGLGFSQHIFTPSDGTYGPYYRSGLLSDASIDKVTKNINDFNTSCTLTGFTFLVNETDSMYLTNAKITLVEHTKQEAGYETYDSTTTKEQIEAAFATDEYKQAVAILTSTKID